MVVFSFIFAFDRRIRHLTTHKTHSISSQPTDGAKSGVGAEAANAARGAKQLTVQEANQILGIESGATWEEIMKKYNHLFDANQKHGSFYLQSKVYRAKERLEEEFKENGWPMPEVDPPEGEQQQQQEGGEQQR